MPVCALYFSYILHEILEFLAVSFHCLQKNQLQFIGVCLNLMLLLCFIYSVVIVFFSVNSLLLVLFLLFGMKLRVIRKFQFL